MNLAPHHQAELRRAGLVVVPIPRGLGQKPPSNASWYGGNKPGWANDWGQVAPDTHYQPMQASGSLLAPSSIAALLNQNASTNETFYFSLPNGMLFRVHPGGAQLDVCLDRVMAIPGGPGNPVGVYPPSVLGVSFLAGMVPIAFKPNCAGTWTTVSSSGTPGQDYLLYQQMQNYSGNTQGYAAYFLFQGAYYRYVPGVPPSGGGFTIDYIQKCVVHAVPPSPPVRLGVGPVAPPQGRFAFQPTYAVAAAPAAPTDDTTLVLAGIAGVLILGAVVVLL